MGEPCVSSAMNGNIWRPHVFRFSQDRGYLKMAFTESGIIREKIEFKIHVNRAMCNFQGVQSVLISHPLIHTLLGFTLAQDVEKKKSGATDSAFS